MNEKILNEILSTLKDISENQKFILNYISNQDEKESISVKETCAILKISSVTLWKLRKDNIIPFYMINKSIRYKRTDVLNYLNSNKM